MHLLFSLSFHLNKIVCKCFLCYRHQNSSFIVFLFFSSLIFFFSDRVNYYEFVNKCLRARKNSKELLPTPFLLGLSFLWIFFSVCSLETRHRKSKLPPIAFRLCIKSLGKWIWVDPIFTYCLEILVLPLATLFLPLFCFISLLLLYTALGTRCPIDVVQPGPR